MLTKLKNKNEGFTIVETLIVLAIAGLIILIVLLAVPALQRSSQNSNIKSDAEAIASGINDFESNNQGVQPLATDITNTSGTLSVGAASGSPSTGKVQPTTVIGTETTMATSPAYANPGLKGTSVGPSTILVDIGEQCPSGIPPGAGGTKLTASPSSVAIFYPINDGNSTATNNGVGCIQS